MTTCVPLLQENDTELFLEASDDFFVLEISGDCAKEIVGGTVVPAPAYYTPVPERIVWLKIRYKNREWEKEHRLPTFELPIANNKVSVMFKPDMRHKIISEAKITLKKVITNGSKHRPRGKGK